MSERRKPKNGPRWTGRLTASSAAGHNVNALDALSEAGRQNPRYSGRTSANHRALFVCPVFINGGLGGARFGVAGSLKPVSDPRSSRRPTAVRSGRVGSIHHSGANP